MNDTKEMAHQEVAQVFRDLRPTKGLIEREKQIGLCHQMPQQRELSEYLQKLVLPYQLLAQFQN